MGIEIERKFLVNPTLWQQVDKPDNGTPYQQGYLLNSPEKTLRVRVAGTKGYVTIKGKTEGFSRKEYEYEIPADEAAELLANFTEICVEKVRYRIPFAGRVWEVDIFAGDNDGLIVAEIELPDEDEVVQLPEWVTDEVTGDTRYYNASLSVHPYRKW